MKKPVVRADELNVKMRRTKDRIVRRVVLLPEEDSGEKHVWHRWWWSEVTGIQRENLGC